MDSAELGNKLEGEGPLAAAIRGAAVNVAVINDVDSDDVQQDIVLAILERFAIEPTFLEQSDSYVVNWGAWSARQKIRAARCRTKKDQPLGPSEAHSNPFDESRADLADDPWEDVNAGLDLPSSDMAGWTRKVVTSLDDQNREICEGTMEGKNLRQIGGNVGLHFTTVAFRLRGEIRHEFLRAGYPG